MRRGCMQVMQPLSIWSCIFASRKFDCKVGSLSFLKGNEGKKAKEGLSREKASKKRKENREKSCL